VIVLRLNGVNQLIHLLNSVAAQRLVILLAIPRAALGGTEPRHDGEQLLDRRFAFH